MIDYKYQDLFLEDSVDKQLKISFDGGEITNTDIFSETMQITESISGWKNGKCITNGKIYSKELKQDILTTHCEFDEKQLAQIVKDMEKANKGTFEDYKKVQEKMYAKKSTICTATDLIKAK